MLRNFYFTQKFGSTERQLHVRELGYQSESLELFFISL